LPRNSSARLLKKEDIEEIAEFDADYFGANRINILSSLYRDYPKHCLVVYDGPRISGYIMCRKTEKGYRIGPWVCNPKKSETARASLAKCMQTAKKNARMFIGVPALNTAAVGILRSLGFEQYSKSIRMRFGKEIRDEIVKGIFAIGGPEKG